MAQKRRSKGEWAEICREFKSSGETAGKFARRRGLKRSTLLWWTSRLRRREESTGPQSGFVEVVPTEVQSPSPVAVVRVGDVSVEFGREVPPAPWVAELASRC